MGMNPWVHLRSPGEKPAIICRTNTYTKRCAGCDEMFCTQQHNVSYCGKKSCQEKKLRQVAARKIRAQKRRRGGK